MKYRINIHTLSGRLFETFNKKNWLCFVESDENIEDKDTEDKGSKDKDVKSKQSEDKDTEDENIEDKNTEDENIEVYLLI